jgi:GTP-binding protein HflX
LKEELFGNTADLKQSQSKRLLATYRRRVHPNELCSAELARHLTEVSREVGRQVGVLIDRRGAIEMVIVGDARQLFLPDIGRARAGHARLRGLRLVHSHLRDEPLTRDDLTDLVLLRLDAIAAIVSDAAGMPGKVYLGQLLPFDAKNPGAELSRLREFESIHDVDLDIEDETLELENEMARKAPIRSSAVEGRAILVAIYGPRGREEADASVMELRELCRTAGVEVAEVIVQARREPDPKTVVGMGKLQDILVRSMGLGADLVVFDRDLSPSQAKFIADETALKVLDRSQLILDIFARRAQSADGKLQVELAQLKYRLPRLVGSSEALSRLAGGIGGRGPGETKLEIDRRRARDRIHQLEEKIERLSMDRQVRRRQRGKAGVPIISIVGYTNAGKSTLLNALTKSEVLAEDKLFATLDPTSRRLRFPRDREVVLTDTVGFIRDLPKDLVAAFRATLEELEDADLLLHVIDASDPRHAHQAAAVERILATLDLEETPRLLVFNKCDRLPDGGAALAHEEGGVALSALKHTGFEELLERCEKLLWREGVVQAPGAEEGPFLKKQV